jgi:hypothetical protein
MTLAAAVAYALDDEPERYRRELPRQALTRRETQVAALVARGMGLAERFVDHRRPVRWWRFYADGRPRLSFDLS